MEQEKEPVVEEKKIVVEEKTEVVEEKPVKKEETPKPKPNSWMFVLSVAVVILAGSTGYFGWQYFEKTDANKQQLLQISNLNTQLNNVKKTLVDLRELFGLPEDINVTPTPTPISSTTPTPSTLVTLKENIEAAISTMNTAALEGYMADSVYVIYAATEFGGPKTPAQAVAALDYLSGATAPWDFDLSDVELDAYRAGFYADYFPADAIVGKSSDDYVVSFSIDSDDQIDGIFIAANAELLLY